MGMTVEQLETHLNGLIEKAVGPQVEEIKAMKEQLVELKKVEPVVHTASTGVIDNGDLRQVGPDQYVLPGGSIINTKSMWAATGKGFKRNNGVFEKLGEEAHEVLTKALDELKTKGSCNIVAKAPLAMSDTVSAQTDASAALFVPEDVRYALLQFAPPGTIVWPRAQVWPMTTDNINWPKLVQSITDDSNENFFGNVALTWTEEGGEKPDTKPEFETLRLTCHELSAYTEITDVLLEDSAINLGNLLTQLFQGAYWHTTDKVFLNGMGGTRPLGVLNHPDVNTVNRVTASRVQYEDLINMSTAHPAIFDKDSVWFMNKSCFNSLRKQKDDNGQPVIALGQGYNDFGEGIAGYALGYPIVISDYKTSALGSTGDIVLGNWKHYFIGERKSISIEMSKHAVFRNNRTAFRTSGRIGGLPEEAKAFTVLQSTADASQAS